MSKIFTIINQMKNCREHHRKSCTFFEAHATVNLSYVLQIQALLKMSVITVKLFISHRVIIVHA